MATSESDYEIKPAKLPGHRNVHVGADIIAILQQSAKTNKWRIARLKTGVKPETHLGVYTAPEKDGGYAAICDTALDAAGLALRYWRSGGRKHCYS